MRQSLAERPRIAEFSTFRLTCRPVDDSDLAFCMDLFSRPEVLAHRPNPAAPMIDDTRAHLARDGAHWRRHGFGRWMLGHAGQQVGLGGLTVKEGFCGLNLSYHLIPEMWGQGLASEFVRSTVDYAAEQLASDELYGLVRPSNIASIRVLEKAGFRDAGLHSIAGGPMRELRIAL